MPLFILEVPSLIGNYFLCIKAFLIAVYKMARFMSFGSNVLVETLGDVVPVTQRSSDETPKRIPVSTSVAFNWCLFHTERVVMHNCPFFF